ncbi:unnamed protein product, partial [Polarella glacialis]
AFLGSGFKALDLLASLRNSVSCGACGGDSSSLRLPGLGAEKAGKLLAACVAETSLLSAVYWVLCAYSLLGAKLEEPLVGQITDLLRDCRKAGGGFSPHPSHEPSLLSTLSAIQIAILLGRVELLGDAQSLKETWRYVLSLQLDDGSFRARE